MGKIGVGLSTYETIGKTVSLAPIYEGMAKMAALMAKSRNDAEKQRQKAESDANKKIQDFLLTEKGKNMYTEKYAPIAREAQDKMIKDIYEDKKRDPNGWMNTATNRMLEAQKTYAWAAEQSKMQTDIEKMAADGYMVPESLLKEFRTNYGDLEGIKKMASELEDYGITVDPNTGVLARANLQKPVEIGDEFTKFKSSRASYGQSGARTEEIIHRDIYGEPIKDESGKPVISDRVVTYKELTPESLENFKIESSQNPAIRQTFKVRRRAEVEKEMAELKAMQQASGLYYVAPGIKNVSASALANIDDKQLKELAVTRAINRQISSFDKTMETGSSVTKRSSGKGITVNVGGEKYVQPVEANYTADLVTSYNKNAGTTVQDRFAPQIIKKIKEAGGSFVFKSPEDDKTYVYKEVNGKAVRYPAVTSEVPAFNAQLAHSKRGTNPDKITQFQDISTQNIFNPETMERIPASDVSKVFKEGTIIDYYFMDGKVYAKMNIELKTSASETPPSLSGITTFIVEVPRNRKLDGVGATLVTTIGGKKYASMYDYFKDMAPSGGAAQPQAQPSTGTSAKKGRLNPKK